MNIVLFLGNLTRDPQLSYTPSQVAVIEFSLARTDKWTGKDGSKQEKTHFIDCKAIGKIAETISKYFCKGNEMLIEGSLDFDSWTDQAGQKKTKLRVKVQGFTFTRGNPRTEQTPAYTPPPQQNQAPQGMPPMPPNEPDPDIPF